MLKILASSCALSVALFAALHVAGGPQPAGETAGASPCDRLPPTDLKRICASGRLVVARYQGQRPPFFFRGEGGQWQGFDVDLAGDIAERLGVEYQPRLAASFNDVVDLVADGSADLGISKLSITLERSQRVRFSKPYMTVYQTLLVNRLSAPMQEDPFTFLDRPAIRTSTRSGSFSDGPIISKSRLTSSSE